MDSIDMREVMGEYTLETAKRDIDKHDLKLVILGGFGGVPKVDDVKRQHFEKKYQVTFIFRGCLRLRIGGQQEDISGYNATILESLRAAYGASVLEEYKAIFN